MRDPSLDMDLLLATVTGYILGTLTGVMFF